MLAANSAPHFWWISRTVLSHGPSWPHCLASRLRSPLCCRSPCLDTGASRWASSNEDRPRNGTRFRKKTKLLCFEWSPPWHFKTACWHHFCLKLLSRDFCPTNYPNHLFHLAGHCACQSVKQDINMSVYMFPAGPQPRPSPPVEVRQGTLGGDTRGWGPAGNTGGDGRGWGPAGNTGRGWSWLRSDRDHCASRVAVEQEEERRRGDEERRSRQLT